MFVLIVGSGRVGSTVAKRMIESGHDVSVLDESPEAHARLDHGSEETWEELGGRFTVGTALEVDALLEAGIEQADVVICSTDGDNTNIVVAQIAQKRFNVPRVLARVLDPYRADWYREQGLETVCPTQSAIEMLTERATARTSAGGDPLMEETR
jgi:trk system potassium uptake protein TrkA